MAKDIELTAVVVVVMVVEEAKSESMNQCRRTCQKANQPIALGLLRLFPPQSGSRELC